MAAVNRSMASARPPASAAGCSWSGSISAPGAGAWVLPLKVTVSSPCSAGGGSAGKALLAGLLSTGVPSGVGVGVGDGNSGAGVGGGALTGVPSARYLFPQ